MPSQEEVEQEVYLEVLQKVLEDFEMVFGASKKLLSKYSCDRQIPLTDSSQIVNTKPYRYSFY